MFHQRTIAEKVTCTGLGLHSGAPVQLTLHPASADTGIVFVRERHGEAHEIAARAEWLSSTAQATTLARAGLSVATVEHLLAALAGYGIDNVRIELDGEEVPVLDGSAGPFCYLLESAGVFTQPTPRRVIALREAVELRDGKRSIRALPCARFAIDYTIEFDHPSIGRQTLQIPHLDPAVFARELARARTFGFLRDVERLFKAGLAQGGSLDNAVLLDEQGVVNPDGLRYPDEFVRHKALDLVGDLVLLGHPLEARVVVERGGHALHQALVREILAHPKSYELREVSRA